MYLFTVCNVNKKHNFQGTAQLFSAAWPTVFLLVALLRFFSVAAVRRGHPAADCYFLLPAPLESGR